MLDYNNDNLNSNSIPSLRQKMINEALDYHQNMNSIVFKRQVKNIATYNNPSGKTDPSQGDILIEGTIKQKVGDIQSAIQRLNQTISYSNDVTMPQAVTPNTRGVAHVSGNGRNNRRVGGVKIKRVISEWEQADYDDFKYRFEQYNLKIHHEMGITKPIRSLPDKPYEGWLEDKNNLIEAEQTHKFQSSLPPNLKFKQFYNPPAPFEGIPFDPFTPESMSYPDYLKHVKERQKTGEKFEPPIKEKEEEEGKPMHSSAIQKIIDRAERAEKLIEPTTSIVQRLKSKGRQRRQEVAAKPVSERALERYEQELNEADETASYNVYKKAQTEFDEYMISVGLMEGPLRILPNEPYSNWLDDAMQLEQDLTTFTQQEAMPAELRSRQQRLQKVNEGIHDLLRKVAEERGLNPIRPMQPQQPPQPMLPQQPPQPMQPQQPQQPLQPRQQLIQPQQPGQGGEPPAAGILSTQSPDARSSSKIKQLIDNSLAAIVSSYNSLIDYIDLQIKQRTFKPRDEQTTSALLKELVEPLKLLIANSAQVTERDAIYGVVEYSRIYNIINDIISKINSCPPFLKVDYRLLTEALPIRRDVIQMPGYSGIDQENHEYLDNLVDRLKEAYATQVKYHPKSQLEKDAQALKLREIDNYYEQITKAGYKPSHEELEELNEVISSKFTEQIKLEPTFEEKTAVESKPLSKEAMEYYKSEYDYLKERKETLSEAFGNIMSESNSYNLQEEPYIKKIDQLTAFMYNLYDKFNDLDRQLSSLDLKRPREEIQYETRIIREQKRDIKEEERVIQHLIHTYGERLHNIRNSEQRRTYDEQLNRLNDEMNDVDYNLNVNRYFLKAYEEQVKEDKPLRKSYKGKRIAQTKIEEEEIPKLLKQRQYHEANTSKSKEKMKERTAMLEPYKQRSTIPIQGPFGNGKPAKAYGGMRPHKSSEDPFGNGPELEPYLTKYLRPSKFRQVKDVPAIESSSDESSGEDEPRTVKRRGMGKRERKLKEDLEIIETHIHPDRAILIEKKTKGMRVGRGKKMAAVKPAHVMRPEQDMWFM
jgi:hypothetical protein